MVRLNTFDIDGVIDFEGQPGVCPGYRDVIITGRSYEEKSSTIRMLNRMGIYNIIYFNPLKFSQKTRIFSGQHKGNTIKYLKAGGFEHGFHFEDDEIQIEEILKIDPTIKIVHVKSNFVALENKKR